MNIFSNPSFLSISSFTIQVSNITNPFPATDYAPITIIQIIASNSAIVETATSSLILTINPGAATCQTAILNPYVYQNGQISVTYSSKYIPSGSTGYNLTIEMDASYPDDLTSTDIAPTVSAPVSSEVSPGMYILEFTYTNSFTITMLMPPSTKPENNFISIYSYNSIGYIDSCTVSITDIQPNTFSAISILQETVQTLTSVKFDLTLSTPLAPTDYLIIVFDSVFDLGKVGTSVIISGYGSLTLTKIGNKLQITSISQQSVLNARLIFNISGVLMPFTTISKYINISLATSDKYFRIVQNYPYSASPGNIISSVSCLNAEIGTVNTSCIFALTTSSSLTFDGLFNIALPNDFPIASGNIFCSISGAGLNSMTTCLYFAQSNSIQAGSLKSTSGNIPPTNLTLNITMTISQYVGTYSLTISSQSSGSIVDLGSASLATISRRLKSSQFSITSSSMVTYSSTVYTMYFSLPFNLGVTYTVVINFPFDTQPGLNVTITGGNFVSFVQQVLTFTSNQMTNNASVIVNYLLTASSIKPTTLSVNINYQNKTYFYGSSTLTMTQIKQFSYINVIQSNQIVFSSAIATITLNNLANNDKVVITPSYSYFYSSNQSNCTTSVVSCGLAGVVSVINGNLTGLTTFSINIQNLGYVGQVQLNITSYDNQQIYAKQSSIFNISVTTPNSIAISANQTNPYLNQESTYSFTLQFSTPNASTLLVTPPSGLIITSVSCVINCGLPSKLTIGYLFSISSTNAKITMTLTNPLAYANTNKFIFKTSNSLGDMDYGEHIPQLICTLPCRSCSNLSASICLSCYSWSSSPILSNGSCISTCPSGLYQAISSTGISSCASCSNLCITCNGAASNCSTCVNGSFYYNQGCYSSCPLGSYTKLNYCISCLQPNCSVCTETVCSSCLSGTSFFNGTCLTVCFASYYSYGGNCIKCASTCLVCSPVNGSCSSCANPYFLYQGTCYATCPTVTFQRLNSALCQTCQPPCATCSGYSNNCTTCLRTYNSSNYFLLSNVCYAGQCPDGFYIDSSSNICLQCSSNCPTCTISACLSCISPLILYQGKCYSQCPGGTYQNSSVCLSCLTICRTCISPSVCTSCISGYNLFNSSCILTCPAFYYSNLTGNICLQCSSPCILCNYAGCISCISGYYMQQTTCTYSCTGSFHPNNVTMTCEFCKSPCSGCTWSDTCTSCISGYSLFGSNCLVSCPIGYYSNGAQCLTCPSLCPTCTFLNNQPACTSCNNNTLLYSFSCVQICPNDTKASDKYCLSSTCSIQNCVSCSGSQCIQCSALYQIDSTYQCSGYVNSSAVAAALFKIPVPFPFLISILMILIISFLLKHNFPKMFSPLFIYPLAGGLEFLCICLWTLLSVFWNQGLEQPLPYQNVVHAPVIIALVYFTFNVMQFLLWHFRIAQDKKYKLWEKQDNRCASLSIAILSLLFSFRLDAFKFSKTAHNPKLSARLLSPQLFNQYSVLAILSLFLSSIIILVSVYISYMQTSMNYLFFTGIEIALISIIMIVFSIAMLCVSKQQLLEDRSEYQVGYDQDQIEGKSIEELLNGLGIVEQHHQHNQYQDSGNAVFRQNDYQSEHFSQDLTLVEPAQLLALQDKIDSQIQLIDNDQSQVDQAKTVIGSEEIFKEPPSSQNSNHILIDEIERDRNEALQLTEQYKLAQKPLISTYPRHTGGIVRQRLPELHQDSSEVESMHSFEQFSLNYTKKKWNKEENQKEKEKVKAENVVIQGEFIEELQIKDIIQGKIKIEQEKKKKEEEKGIQRKREELQAKQKKQEERIKEQKRIAQQKLRQQQAKKIQQQAKRKQEQLEQKRKKEQERLKKIQEQKRRQQRWKLMKEEAKRKKQQQERLIQLQKQAMRKEQEQLRQKMRKEQEELRIKFLEQEAKEKKRLEQQRMKQLQQTKRELEKLYKLKQNLKALEGITQQYEAKNNDLQNEQRKLEERQRQNKQRALMAMQDRLSRMTLVFENMWKKAAQIRLRPQKNKKISNEQSQKGPSQQITYHNDDNINLISQLSPRKIKVSPRPLPQQYTRRHLFVEQGKQILQSEEEQQEYFQEQLQIVFNANGTNQANIQQQQKVEKPKGIMRHHRPDKTKINHLVYQDKEQRDIEQLKLKSHQINFAVDASKLKSNAHKQMSKQDSDEVINMQFENKLTEELDEGSSQWTNPYGLEQHNQPQVQIQDYSARSIHTGSSDTHWPIEPEMQERLLEIERRADKYIKQPKKKEGSKEFIYQNPSHQIYQEAEEDQGEKQFEQIVFEETDNIIEQQSLATGKTKSISSKKKYPLGRVNRRIIDLSPDR